MLFLMLLLVNHTLTPGAVRPLSLQVVCTTKWGIDTRNVDKKKKAGVFAAYGIPVSERHLYVIDHLIPRELAGADEPANLWPQLVKPSYAKNIQEGALHRAVCASNPTITLEAAQQQMRMWNKE